MKLPVRRPSSMLRAAAIAAILTAVAAPGRARGLDVEPWDRVLREHARRGGLDYGALSEDREAMADLDRFLAAVAEMPDDAPLASWLNAYNAIVVKSVVERYPMRSVRDVPGFFDRARHRVAGRMRTLDDLEHRVIRVRFPDARVHAALNCAARSCPPLHGRAFREASLDRTLDRLARAMVASERHVRVRDGALEVSQLFEWFGDDFRRDGGGSIAGFIRRFAAADHPARALSADAPVRHIEYDWRLNDR